VNKMSSSSRSSAVLLVVILYLGAGAMAPLVAGSGARTRSGDQIHSQGQWVQQGAPVIQEAPVAVGTQDSVGARATEVKLQGAGATVPASLYQKWFREFTAQHPGTNFDYQWLGSVGGIARISSNKIDFGGSDVPMTDDQLKAASGEILHIPTVLGAVAVTYNVPSLGATSLKLSGKTIAGIFLGKIKQWNDPRIAGDNPGIALPGVDINVVHRLDENGTTFAFTDFLSKVSPDWKGTVGTGMSVRWPVGTGGKGIEGLIDRVRQISNSIAYIELTYAQRDNFPIADVKNADGHFVHPNLESINAAATIAARDIPADLRGSITYASAGGAYPISSFTYFLVYKQQSDYSKGKALVRFLWWAIHDGQKSAPGMNYAPLPAEIVLRAEEKIKSIAY
jgi:phosphate transport system substrate-binding protein